jgi:hypothetical protein
MDALVAAKTRATTASLALAEAETAQAAASAVQRQLLVQRPLVSEWLVVHLLL